MALIADFCPNCKRITRCQIIERSQGVGGIFLGVPFWLLVPKTADSVCGECGLEFRSATWDGQKTVSPSDAVGMPLDMLLALTNSALNETRTIDESRADARLDEAFSVYDQLLPGRFRNELKTSLKTWRDKTPEEQARLLSSFHESAKALAFARAISPRYRAGNAGCLIGAVCCVAAWLIAWFAIGANPRLWSTLAILFAGLIAGTIPAHFLILRTEKRWVQDVLMPAAREAGIRPAMLVKVMDGSCPRGAVDEIQNLRSLVPVLREQAATQPDGSAASSDAIRRAPRRDD